MGLIDFLRKMTPQVCLIEIENKTAKFNIAKSLKLYCCSKKMFSVLIFGV
jgi:hypothetical protein